MKEKRTILVNRSDRPIPFEAHLLLLCEMLFAADEEKPPTPQAEASADAA